MKQTLQLGLSGVLIAALALAQDSRGTISGRVTDSSGGVVAEARVTVTSEAQATVVKGSSNHEGLFTIPYLLPGFYGTLCR